MENGIIIVETNGGFVCANAGVDESNVSEGYATLLPKNPDESASKPDMIYLKRLKKQVAVIISDTFGRPFRLGQTDCAIGISGIDSIIDYEGTKDTFGRELRVTAIAIGDELCSAAELVRGKTLETPIAIIRNYKFSPNTGTANDLIRPKNEDLFFDNKTNFKNNPLILEKIERNGLAQKLNYIAIIHFQIFIKQNMIHRMIVILTLRIN